MNNIFVACVQISFVNPDGSESLHPQSPFRIRLPKTLKTNAQALPGNKSNLPTDSDANTVQERLVVETYVPPDPGPYPQDKPKQNTVRFTPTQVQVF